MDAAPAIRDRPTLRRHNHVKITLRPPQAAHLRYIAKWDDCSLTRAFLSILALHRPSNGLLGPHGAPTLRSHFALNDGELAQLDALARQWGMQRAEVVRRVIDMAMAEPVGSGAVRVGD